MSDTGLQICLLAVTIDNIYWLHSIYAVTILTCTLYIIILSLAFTHTCNVLMPSLLYCIGLQTGYLANAYFIGSFAGSLIVVQIILMNLYFCFTVYDVVVVYYLFPLGSKAGFLGSSYFIGSFAGSMAWGWLSDTWGRRPTLILGSVGTIFASLLFGFR